MGTSRGLHMGWRRSQAAATGLRGRGACNYWLGKRLAMGDGSAVNHLARRMPKSESQVTLRKDKAPEIESLP
ncbi:MAG: hypothetical protein NTW21_15405 [Verrucomicrobia bacterium]|nr:hypothetical protein [Verrucomicrobiota bacterium]